MKKIRAAIVGYGNIGRYVLDALQVAPDFEVAGIVRRDAADIPDELKSFPVVSDIACLKEVDVAILCTPTRSVETYASKILKMGINTVDSFDIHTEISGLHERLGEIAKKYNSVSIISAGWDPGSDSMVRALLEACAPKGITYTNFGPGMSMGHTVAVKAIEGVKAALSIEFGMKINNPALTGQILVATARASVLQRPGCYTLIEIPVIDLLYGDRKELIKHLV